MCLVLSYQDVRTDGNFLANCIASVWFPVNVSADLKQLLSHDSLSLAQHTSLSASCDKCRGSDCPGGLESMRVRQTATERWPPSLLADREAQ